MRSKYESSVVTLSAKPCHVTQSRACTPIDAILRPCVHTPVYFGTRSPGMSKRARPLGLQRPAERVERGLGNGLRQCRMRMDRELDFLDRVLVRAGQHELVDHFRRVGADDMRAEDLSVLGAADDLHEAFRLPRRA